MRELNDAPAEFFIICQAESKRRIRSITEKIEEIVYESVHNKPLHVEGAQENNWVLIDYFNVVVHIFRPEIREFYQLDELWGDAGITEYRDK